MGGVPPPPPKWAEVLKGALPPLPPLRAPVLCSAGGWEHSAELLCCLVLCLVLLQVSESGVSAAPGGGGGEGGAWSGRNAGNRASAGQKWSFPLMLLRWEMDRWA